MGWRWSQKAHTWDQRVATFSLSPQTPGRETELYKFKGDWKLLVGNWEALGGGGAQSSGPSRGLSCEPLRAAPSCALITNQSA